MARPSEQKPKLHYLRIKPKAVKGFWWNCVCGQAEGEGPSEEACEISYQRHVIKEGFRVTGRLYGR